MSRKRASQSAIVGVGCRLPGAPSPQAFWDLLVEGRCSVQPRPNGRWPVHRFLHERPEEVGFAYSMAGGYLEDPFGFDAAAFGISPREAQQMDPQQRLLLEVVWEALEDAGLPPSQLAGHDVGVYVGASNVDYQNAASVDPASIESHYMTGNALAIASNRISYVFDWKGPSFTVDAACSASFVALSQAMAALEAGMIDTAVVAGVNMLLSPAPFVGFSRARMLSPTGLCRPFSADADGYVRAEGAVALILRRGDRLDGLTPRAWAVASGINSDGRTVGISLPSSASQGSLIERLYERAGVDPGDLAFVEAHGTGTRVGDPAEAEAIGRTIGLRRRTALPVGSAKSNVGHLESASGLVGALKAILSLDHGLYPATLHLGAPNPDIDFEALNLAPAREAVPLRKGRKPLLAGVCNYGFGGTNAHLILREADRRTAAEATVVTPEAPARVLMLSAHSRDALRALAGAHARAIREAPEDPPPALRAAAVAWRRERLPHRLALPIGPAGVMADALSRHASGVSGRVIEGRAGPPGRLAFVYSGNGAQWAGMARAALARSAAFAEHLRAVDAVFRSRAGWSMADRLLAPGLAEELRSTSIAQPLLFGVQASLTRALAGWGVKPDLVLGHSIGEIAAAHAAGALSLSECIDLVLTRSRHQEPSRGRGGMVVVACDETAAASLAEGLAGIETAALNGPASTTLSGTPEAMGELVARARSARIAAIVLDVDYPFHSIHMDPCRDELVANLAALRPRDGDIPFVSTVTGRPCPGSALDAPYWWHNVRRPVHFRQAVEQAIDAGVTAFLEIGPKPILGGSMADILTGRGVPGVVLPTLSGSDDEREGDPVEAAVLRLLVQGAAVREEALFGTRPGQPVRLPTYPWQRQRHMLPTTAEALLAFGRPGDGRDPHPLLGFPFADGSPEWRVLMDATTPAILSDHKVDGIVVVPAAAFVEMMACVARSQLGAGAIEIEDFDISHPLPLQPDAMRQVSTVWDAASGHVDIRSRPRFEEGPWTRHARGRVRLLGTVATDVDTRLSEQARHSDAEAIYQQARDWGLQYGPSFRLAQETRRDPDRGETLLSPPRETVEEFILHPASLDAALHGLFLDRPTIAGTEAFLPVRARRIRVWQDRTPVTRSFVVRGREVGRSAITDVTLFAADGSIVATLEGLVFRSVPLGKASAPDRTLRLDWIAMDGAPMAGSAPVEDKSGSAGAWRLVQAFALALTHRVVAQTLQHGAGEAVEPGAIASGLLGHLEANGLAERTDQRWMLSEAPDYTPEDVLAALMAVHPGAHAEIDLCAHALLALPAAVEANRPATLPHAVREHVASEAELVTPALDSLVHQVTRALGPRSLRPSSLWLAPPWNDALVRRLLPLAEAGRVDLVLAGSDGPEARAILARLGHPVGLRHVDPAPAGAGEADIGVALVFDHQNGSSARLVRERLRAGGTWLQATAPQDLALSVLLGWHPPSPDDTAARLREEELVGLEASHHHGWHVVTASKPCAPAPIARMPTHPKTAVAAGGQPAAFGTALVDVMVSHGGAVLRADGLLDVLRTTPGATPESVPGESCLFHLDTAAAGTSGPELAEQIMALKARLVETRPARLWVVTRGAQDPSPDPGASAIWALGRVARNECPEVDLGLVDLSADLTLDQAAKALCHVAVDAGREREIAVGPAGWRVARAARGEAPLRVPVDDTTRSVLTLPRPGAMADATWRAKPRLPPGPGEVEVEVAACGLNFRDVLLALGVLDEDLLGDGLSKAALGLELAGTVTAVGEGVTDLVAGDPVVGFAAGAMASHVTLPAGAVVRRPASLSAPAGATLPVAFSTAWYGLVEVARLEAGETVLVHGGAGGVGMAAIQIAKLRGARVFATAGSEERRTLARLLGADDVCDSRSLLFADQIRERHGGVDVVLNSLSGEAMVQSLRLLRPFGRFVELGKRDYVENTSIDLRPFLKNVTYAGVDLDQLLAERPALAREILRAVMREVEAGRLSPLPHRPFEAEQAGQAFRLLQTSGHLGKVLLRPARIATAQPVPAPRFRVPDGPVLVVGGTAGFGFETACWLAERGARTLVLASRRGAVSPTDDERLCALRARGVTVAVEAVDVTDRVAMAALVARVAERFGPIRGAVHTAMVLEDGLIEGLSPPALTRVLAPKVDGILAMEAALEGQPLDIFVAYSSVTTLVGNPGQAAYVAANAFLEAVMRRRRAAGLPGLAVAWGAIAGAGVLAGRRELEDRLRRTTGVSGLPVADALAALGALLARGTGADPVCYVSDVATGAIAHALPLLQTPSFERLRNPEGAERAAARDTGWLDAFRQAAPEERLGLVVAGLAEEIAAILQLSATEIDASRPLNEFGMDSLMALELRMRVERRFGIDLPLLSIAGQTIATMAQRLASSLAPAAADSDADRVGAIEQIGAMHVPDLPDAFDREALEEQIERKRVLVGGLM